MPMNIIVILAHPNRQSFNRAISDVVVKTLKSLGHMALFHDLYEEQFDPVLRYNEITNELIEDPVVKQQCMELSTADGIVIIHPNWWGQPPAVLKGWIDRIFRAGVAYRFEEGDKGAGVPVGLLKMKNAVVFNTSDTPEEREMNEFGDPLETIWRNCIFKLCGVKEYYRRMFEVVVTSAPEERAEWLREVEMVIKLIFKD